MRGIMVVLVLWCAAASVHAQMVYKCVGKGGAVSFQSEPCAAHQRTAKAVYAPPEPERPATRYQQPAQVASSGNNYGQVIYNAPSPASSERDQRRAQCEQAKADRAATLQRVGLSRTHDLLRQLDATVYDACNGL